MRRRGESAKQKPFKHLAECGVKARQFPVLFENFKTFDI
jgi:hypothetical protein